MTAPSLWEGGADRGKRVCGQGLKICSGGAKARVRPPGPSCFLPDCPIFLNRRGDEREEWGDEGTTWRISGCGFSFAHLAVVGVSTF